MVLEEHTHSSCSLVYAMCACAVRVTVRSLHTAAAAVKHETPTRSRPSHFNIGAGCGMWNQHHVLERRANNKRVMSKK